MGTDLSLEDLEFLRTVRDINTNPSEYENTEGGEVPATTSAIRVGSELDRSKVKYRAKPSDALEDFVVVHEADFNPETNSFGPKSVELTDAGIDAIAELDDGSDYSEEIAELRDRLDRLEKIDLDGDVDAGEITAELQSIRGSLNDLEDRVEQVADEQATMQSGEWGAIGDEKADKLDRVLKKSPVTLYLFDVLFDIEVDYLVEDGPYDEDELEDARERISELLAAAGTDGHSVDETASTAGTDSDGDFSETPTASDGGADGSGDDADSPPLTPPSNYDGDDTE